MTEEQGLVTTSLRLPVDVYVAVKRQAAEQHRSMTAQIVYILEQAVQRPPVA